ncbi:hypothetical protein BGZ63DRAFT_425038 [Mariannaea sp. PMI_226]|nr:hypothetical protein BGZ63DRAFT_425038 [Mariannaea sp. PMI_226]
MFPSRIWLLTTWLMGCALSNAQTGSHVTNDTPNTDALYNVRSQLCGGKYANAACGAVDDNGANTASCWEFDANNPSYQGLIIGDNPPAQDCWDAFEAIINNTILETHVTVPDTQHPALSKRGRWSHAVYTYSGRTYLMVIDSK